MLRIIMYEHCRMVKYRVFYARIIDIVQRYAIEIFHNKKRNYYNCAFCYVFVKFYSICNA
jgi:hypothetical protein